MPDLEERPCGGTLENCNSISDSDAPEGKLTDGKLLATFRGEETNYAQCYDDQFFGLHFDLPSDELFDHGQILLVMTNASTQNRKEVINDAKLLTWPHISLWGEETEGKTGSSADQFSHFWINLSHLY